MNLRAPLRETIKCLRDRNTCMHDFVFEGDITQLSRLGSSLDSDTVTVYGRNDADKKMK